MVDITITLAAATKKSVYIPCRITRNGETSYADYRATHGGYNLGPSGHLGFGAGTTEKTVTFAAKDDELNDDDESLFRFPSFRAYLCQSRHPFLQLPPMFALFGDGA